MEETFKYMRPRIDDGNGNCFLNRPSTQVRLEFNVAMESWLEDVKRVRIPRPKFGGKYPVEPPKDYLEDGNDLNKQRLRDDKNLTKATEDLRRTLQEKL